MKANVVLITVYTVLCLATLGLAVVMLWVSAELWKGRFRWKVPGIERLTPAARLSFGRRRSIALMIAAAWLIAGAVGTVWLGLVMSAWSAVLSVAAAIVVYGYHSAAVKHGVKRA